MTQDPEHIAAVQKLIELKRQLDLEDAWAAGAHAMVPIAALSVGALAKDLLHSWWMGALVLFVAWVGLSYIVHIKAYKVQNEYEKATSTNRYAGERRSAAAREHLFGPNSEYDQ